MTKKEFKSRIYKFIKEAEVLLQEVTEISNIIGASILTLKE